MKKYMWGCAVILTSAIAAAGHAQVKEGDFSLTSFFGGYTFEGNEDLKRNRLT